MDYWIGIAKQFPEISIDFLNNDDLSVEIVSDLETKPLELNTFTETIRGIDEILSTDTNKKQNLYISEMNSRTKMPKIIHTTSTKNPCIFVQYNYENPEIDSADFQSEIDSTDFSEAEKLVEIEKYTESENDTLQVILPIYSIEKHITQEKKELISLDDMKYADIAHAVAKRYISHIEKKSTGNTIPKNMKEHETNFHEKKTIQISSKFKNSIPKNFDLNNNNKMLNDLNISIKKCFKIDEILFFVVKTSPKNRNETIEDEDTTEICLPESIMKKHFPTTLIQYFEKNIVFKE